MSFSDWEPNEVEEVRQGLLLLGWRADSRLTSDDAEFARDIAHEALGYKRAGCLTSQMIDNLAARAFDIMAFQIMNVDERAFMTSGPYKESKFFASLVPLIDEATLCYYRGYYTAALATLFVIVESYLRQLAAWPPESRPTTFAQLRASVKKHPASSARDEAEGILAVIYSRYETQDPAQFLFNRHGLLHGLRGPQNIDGMNCVRVFILFDVLCSAEGLARELVYDKEFYSRHAAYGACLQLANEVDLMQGY